MADNVDGLIFSEFLVDNATGTGLDTDGDGTDNKSDEFIELQNTTGSPISLDGYEVWSDDRGFLFGFGSGDTIAPGQTATIVGEYTGTPPAGFYDAGRSEGNNWLEDGQGSQNDTIYLVNTATGEYIAFSYGDPVQAPSPPTGFPGTVQSGSGESINSGAPNGTAFARDSNGDWVEGTPDPGNPGVVCYAPGTMIDTPDGPRAVETLRLGDLVMTLDHGPKPIRWTHSGDHPLEEAEVDAKPVLIKAGALGRNLPAHDLIVSPQHRILVGEAGQLHKVFATVALAPAKSLTKVPGIRHMKGNSKITWIHFACDRHEVVTANGCLSESLLLGPMVVNGLSPDERRALADIFGPAPTPDAALNGPPARECLTVGAVKRQIDKHLKEKGALLAEGIKKCDVDTAMERYEAERLREANPRSQVNMKHVA
ncbi:Hint domain-containing protein [Roseobacter sp.]|uniref:Hint domain-containing protein n=1 Tax=Roseobacter sp. TaxID=1907202 RepID=UPI00385CE31C